MFVSWTGIVIGVGWFVRLLLLGLSIDVTLFSEDVALLNIVLLLTEVGGEAVELVTDVSELERCKNVLTRPL